MQRPLKKTETIEIRVPYETKTAFMARCREDGVSASEALRTFIGAQLEAPPAAARRRDWRRPLQLAAGLAVALGVAATAAPSIAGSVDRIGFSQLDSDGSGGLSPAELSRGARLELRLQAETSGLEIGRATIRRAGSPGHGPDGELFNQLLRSAFEGADTDRNGSISFGEFRRR